MSEGGYDVNKDMSLVDMIELLDLSNIDINDIKQIDAGVKCSFVLKTNGTLWAAGWNNYKLFTQLDIRDVKYISCGNEFVMAIKKDGSLWGCGNNADGQLGLGDTTYRSEFTQITTDVKQVICSSYNMMSDPYNSSIILKTDGSVWSCGRVGYGNLGLGDNTESIVTTFTKVTTNVNNDVKEIYGSQFTTFIIKNDGSLWATGHNTTGALGLGDTTRRYTFTQVTTNINNDVKQIACSSQSTIILKTDGTVWSCGSSGNGMLGYVSSSNNYRTRFTQMTTFNDVKKAYVGENHVFILKNDGSLWACGKNTTGALGLGNTADTSNFTQVTTNINNDVVQIYGCEYGPYDTTSLGSVVHSFIIKNDGSLWACGGNRYGQLGLGNTTDKTTFTKINRGF